MPYPNEHACRLKDPAQFKACRRTERTSEGKVYGVLTCERKTLPGRWQEQAFRYSREIWSEAAARAHCERHQGRFEGARPETVKKIDVSSLTMVKKRDVIPTAGLIPGLFIKTSIVKTGKGGKLWI